MRKLTMTCAIKEEEELDDQWTEQLVTHAKEKEQEEVECQWMMHLLMQVDQEEKEYQEEWGGSVKNDTSGDVCDGE